MKSSHTALLLLSLVCALFALLRLEAARGGIEVNALQIAQAPATYYQSTTAAPSDTLVVVTHGFAGSRQMMEAISLSLARAGHAVVAFDFIGHGRHPALLSPDIGRLEGTTEDLVRQTLKVIGGARAIVDRPRLALVGHSMATDIVIRAASRRDDVASIIAISMYSDAITATFPERLLILSGAREARLREVALEAVARIGEAKEGETVTQGDIARRAVAAPYVGHVGVLWSQTTLAEATRWLGETAAPVRTGPWLAVLLGSLLILFRPLSRLLPDRPRTAPASPRRAWLAALLPLPLVALSGFADFPLFGVAGFGALALGFGAWGALALLILRPALRLSSADALAALLLLGWALGGFALALDRYGAAFVPSGPRAPLMAALLPATVLFALADRALVAGRGIVNRLALRLPFLAAFLGAIALAPDRLGLVFTVAPVLVLFFLVYGTMAGWAARRIGPLGPGVASGVILAWSIAASTPLFFS